MRPIQTAVTAGLLLAAVAMTANAATAPKFIAEVVPPDHVDRTVVLDAGTRWVNVTQGERVKFIINGREFAVAFDGVAEPVNLQRIAPDGMLDHRVNAYVAVNPADLPN